MSSSGEARMRSKGVYVVFVSAIASTWKREDKFRPRIKTVDDVGNVPECP